MRNAFAEKLFELGMLNPELMVVVADISPVGSMEKFRTEFPQRFIDVGVSEQGMVGFCAGLALRGLRPFAYTIATFSAYRPFEMVRDDLCYQNLPVVVVGMGAGIVYSTLGATHLTQEDIAVMGAIPNMTILAPCDPLELGVALEHCMKTTGPVYLRIGKSGEPVLTAQAVEPFVFGKIRYISRGKDVAVIAFGHVMDLASEVATGLAAAGRSVSLVSCHTMKPIDREGLIEMMSSHKQVVVLEEHSCIGGLAMQAKAIAWEAQARCEMRTFSLKDEFIHLYGSHADLRRAHGLDATVILEALKTK